MIIIDSLKNSISGLSKKDFRWYAGSYIGACMLCIIGIVVYYSYALHEAKDKIKQINQTRVSVQKILTDFGQVTAQREKIDLILKKDRSFYIQQFFQDLTKRLNISREITDKPSVQKLENGYTEESLTVNLAKITTQQLCEILQHIEKEERIYIKYIDIVKTIAKKINVAMVIATLIPKSE